MIRWVLRFGEVDAMGNRLTLGELARRLNIGKPTLFQLAR